MVDDERAIVKLITYHLERDGFRVTPAYDGEEALKLIRSSPFDLVILDIMLPKVSGWDVLRTCRLEGRQFPVLFLTARTDEVDRVAGLELGADDYITKPFSPRELVARVRAHLRRLSPDPGNEARAITVGPVSANQVTREVTVNGVPIDLTAKEFELLVCMMKHPGRVFTRGELLEKVWGWDTQADTRTVDVHVSRLRQKIDPLIGSEESYIQTIRNVGYRVGRTNASHAERNVQ